jgi:hypothetical protein
MTILFTCVIEGDCLGYHKTEIVWVSFQIYISQLFSNEAYLFRKLFEGCLFQLYKINK